MYVKSDMNLQISEIANFKCRLIWHHISESVPISISLMFSIYHSTVGQFEYDLVVEKMGFN